MMKKKTMSKMICLCACLAIGHVYADPIVINNNNGGGGPSQAPQVSSSPCPPANQNNIYDPRVPPAGVYSSRNADGSSSTTYTTGEKKPYIVDNNCNNGVVAQPYVYMGGGPGPRK